MGREESSGVIDLGALMAADVEGIPLPPKSNPAPVCNPLETVPNDVYLIVLRDQMATPAEVIVQPSQATRLAHLGGHFRVALGVVAVATLVGAAAIASSRAASGDTAVATTTLTDAPTQRIRTDDAPPVSTGAHPARLSPDAPAGAKGHRSTAFTSSSHSARVRAAAPAAVEAGEVVALPASEKPATEPEAAAAAATEPPPSDLTVEQTAKAEHAERTSLEDAIDGTAGGRKEVVQHVRPKTSGPDRPALGAVMSALRGVLPEARECLQSSSAVRNGRIVFASDGSVVQVQLIGTAPEDECVRSALAKAKVPAFVEETFSTPVTVRP
jgi:hypothetical protein